MQSMSNRSDLNKQTNEKKNFQVDVNSYKSYKKNG